MIAMVFHKEKRGKEIPKDTIIFSNRNLQILGEEKLSPK